MPYAKKLRTVALVAAALVLIGTTSASAAGKIGGNQIKKNAIASKHIKKGAVTTKDVKNNNLTGKDMKDGSVGTNDIKNGTVASGDIKDGTIASGDIKNGTVGTGDLANGSVTAAKLAPGAVAFPNSLWSTQFRNQSGTAESNVQTGPGGDGQLGAGSLRLFTATPTDVAAFGNSLEFAGVRLDQITDVQYSTYNPDAAPLVRPSLRIEINPHLDRRRHLRRCHRVHHPRPQAGTRHDGMGDHATPWPTTRGA